MVKPMRLKEILESGEIKTQEQADMFVAFSNRFIHEDFENGIFILDLEDGYAQIRGGEEEENVYRAYAPQKIHFYETKEIKGMKRMTKVKLAELMYKYLDELTNGDFDFENDKEDFILAFEKALINYALVSHTGMIDD